MNTQSSLHLFYIKHVSIFLLSLLSLIFLWYSLFIEKNQFILQIDSKINSIISNLHSSEVINQFFIFITHCFDPKIFLSWFFLLLAVLVWQKKKYEAFFLFFGVAGGQTVKIIMKWITDRPRPENPFGLYVHESSFPSGHAMTAIFLALALGYLCTAKLQKFTRYTARILLFTIGFCVAFSRIFTQVHYFSDVLTGMILAIGSFSFTLLFFTFLETEYKHTELYRKIFS